VANRHDEIRPNLRQPFGQLCIFDCRCRRGFQNGGYEHNPESSGEKGKPIEHSGVHLWSVTGRETEIGTGTGTETGHSSNSTRRHRQWELPLPLVPSRFLLLLLPCGHAMDALHFWMLFINLFTRIHTHKDASQSQASDSALLP